MNNLKSHFITRKHRYSTAHTITSPNMTGTKSGPNIAAMTGSRANNTTAIAIYLPIFTISSIYDFVSIPPLPSIAVAG